MPATLFPHCGQIFLRRRRTLWSHWENASPHGHWLVISSKWRLHAEFVRAENVIVTDSNFGNAAPDIEATRKQCKQSLLPLLDSGIVPIVSGYSGADALGKSTTLGRGGSDYSATIIGAAAGADEVCIWTDVDGVLTADPRICPDAATLPEITFAEAIELAYYGAKVIHPKAAYPAAEAGFPVWIKNSFRPECCRDQDHA